ncbi:MAG: tryptophan-rich sensory protein [Hyphomonadaceae bacterium]|nr:tryptophan-rich sensory protein [Hyphomonadaceae bacterium]
MTTVTAAKPSWLTYGAIIFASLAVAYMGAQISIGSEDAWYAGLNKASLTPPDWVFGVVWPVLYVLMAVSAILVRRAAGSFEACSKSLGLFFAQLIPNLAWSYAFFGFSQPMLALLIIATLWVMILAMIASFRRWSQRAAWLQLPYLIWISFAAYLNAFIVAAN